MTYAVISSSFSILAADLNLDRGIFVEYFTRSLLAKRSEKLLFSPMRIIQNQMFLKKVGVSRLALLYCKCTLSF